MRTPNARQKRPKPPLDKAGLEALALFYVGRFATSRAKLTAYLERKLRERGWDDATSADPRAVAEKMAGAGYIDDRAYASSKARSLLSRGYGGRRVGLALHAAGIDEADRAEANETSTAEAATAAMRFAQKRRIGPFATTVPDPRQREKAIAAMLRAGHPLDLVRKVISLRPGENLVIDS